MKFIFANETYINVDRILWIESRNGSDDVEMVVTVQFNDKKLTWTGAMANEFMGKWNEFIAAMNDEGRLPADTASGSR